MGIFIVKRRNRWIALLLGAFCCAMLSSSSKLHAAVVVFSNQSPKAVTFVMGDGPNERTTHKAYKIAPGDVLPVPVDEVKSSQKMLWFDSRQNVGDGRSGQSPDIQSVVLVLNSIYTFTGEESLTLKWNFGVGVPETPSSSARARSIGIDAVVPVPIMILVDDDEPRRREIWERELRERVKQASDIFEKTARIRFEIVKVGTWETDDRTVEFNRTLSEFQRTVKPEPGVALAIGFTSQYEVQTKGRFHMGGTRGPLFPYILLREWSQHVGKPERLELLVHELGHVFGATHTPDQSSVMRPVVGDNRSNAKSFRIGFDPLNTLAIYLFCEPLRLNQVRSLRQFPPESRENLLSVYGELGRRFPKDNSAAIYQTILRRADRNRLTVPRKNRR